MQLRLLMNTYGACQVALVVKNLPVKVGDIRDRGSIPGLGRSPGGGPGTHSSVLVLRISRQGGLACCDSWGHNESDTTERLI